ncbi:hypothetical protein BBJ28_00000647 [Nothophytophthora sp. Chile5]|nr:hypothetical protein BBJ28_00000647 [Nothophytophthora sp. Chile5]
MESEAANGGVSEEMLALYEAQRRAHETVLNLQTQIEEEEATYLEETPHGNIVRGWDGFIDSKQPRKDANPKKIKPYTEAEHLFSDCCFYATLASEPSFDLVDLYDSAKDESSGRRKLTVTLSVGKAAGSNASNHSSSSVHDSDSLHSGPAGHSAYRSGKGSKLSSAQKANDRKAAAAHPTSGKGSNASSGGKGSGSYPHSAQQHGKAAKLKKRKRDKLEYTNTANDETTAASAAAKTHEAGQDARTGHSVASTAASPARAAASSAPQGSVDDFLDVF